MAEPETGPRRARRTRGNASSGIRRRLGVFLFTDAIRAIQAGGIGWVVGTLGIAGGAAIAISDFTHLAYVKTITASCSDLATASDRGSCLTVGHESHHYAFALLGLFVIIMAFGAAVGGSRPAAVALLIAGAVGLGITLLHDLPKTSESGQVGVAFAQAKAHPGLGFWLALIGSLVALLCGAFATWRTPPPRRAGRSRPTGDAPPPDPDEASEPASA